MSAAETRALPRRRRAVYALQAAALRAMLAGLRRLPLETASAIGGAVGRTVGPWTRADRVARANLRAAFPEMDRAELERVMRGIWDNLGRVAGEWAQVDLIDTTDPARVVVAGEEHITAAREAGEPFILFSAHMANWELASVCAAQRGVPLANIYRAAGNPYTERLIREVRGRFCAELLRKGREGARGAIRVLRENRPLGMLIDQKLNEGLAIPFFGRPAMTATAPAELALRFRCRVLPVRLERLSGARFRVTVEPPLPLPDSGDHAADTETLLTDMTARVEAWVRERPEQWFWVHRRWPRESD